MSEPANSSLRIDLETLDPLYLSFSNSADILGGTQ